MLNAEEMTMVLESAEETLKYIMSDVDLVASELHGLNSSIRRLREENGDEGDGLPKELEAAIDSIIPVLREFTNLHDSIEFETDVL